VPNRIPMSEGPSPAKAAEMLRDGTVHGKPISDRQKRFFGARASQRTPMAKRGKRPKSPRRAPRSPR